MIIRQLRFVAATLLLAALGSSQTGTTARVSVSSSGQQANGTNAIPRSALSDDGSVVVFVSLASNLVPGDTNGCADIFVHDRLTHTTERVSVDSAGHEANNISDDGGISGDGRSVVFWSAATNLTQPGSPAGAIYLRDRVAGTTVRVSDFGESALEPSISGDGRFVAFTHFTGAGAVDVRIYDVLADVVNSQVLIGGGRCGQPSLSRDGRYVAFTFEQPLVPSIDVYRRDRQLGTTVLASPGLGGAPANGRSTNPSITGDGQRIAYRGEASNLVAGDTNGVDDVFVWDAATSQVSMITHGIGGVQTNAVSMAPAFSADGQHVGFLSDASNLVPGDTNARADGFVYDMTTGAIRVASLCANGAIPSLGSGRVSVSANADIVAFSSGSTDIVPGDTNSLFDVFLSGIGVSPGDAFCFGDGPTNGGPDCPCSNNVAIGVARGCTNSTGNGGRLVATGNASLSADTVTLTGSDMAPASFSLFLQSPTNTGAAPYFFDGLRCVGPSFVRLTTKMSVAGTAAIGSPSTSISILGGVASPGTQYYQVVYRNNAGLCNFLANATNGVAVVWGL